MSIGNGSDICSTLLAIMEKLYSIKDLHALLDAVLLQARQFTHADAGSIYLIENGVLNFSYTHNDTLFGALGSSKYLYTSRTLPIDHHSLAGYVALTGKPLVIDDAYRIPPEMPFSFNRSFDQVSGYRTKSILAVPLITSTTNTVGVMQIINPLDRAGELSSFTPEDQVILSYFAQNAAAAIDRAKLTREIFLRMIKMCELRDPLETGVHATRVGAYAAEIYHRWSLTHGIDGEEIRRTKDLLRIAAMLHDLGKIAIPDLILKKPSGLDNDEFHLMKYHTIHGARLFKNTASDLDVLSAEIALNHHERWDGQGYPGKIDNIFQDQVQLGEGKRGEEIPLAARIVAVADVYDALVSKRVYKAALSEDQTLGYIKDQSGKHFDPQVVDAFLAIYDVIVAIGKKYREEAAPLNPVTALSPHNPA
ncbi:MAG: HD domain-containing protein [Syntrophobacterales bacterium]|jgi:HD-GYP domain-containing protein (c-di-GMP phosphodiesterase class II)|nr:HD domain-containing protein [Syntrophobacterales bacterium]